MESTVKMVKEVKMMDGSFSVIGEPHISVSIMGWVWIGRPPSYAHLSIWDSTSRGTNERRIKRMADGFSVRSEDSRSQDSFLPNSLPAKPSSSQLLQKRDKPRKPIAPMLCKS
ncbi:hypothetical protein QUC31_005678 [Theobroma cacao]